MTYQEFLKKKEIATIEAGFEVDKEDINDLAFDYQKDIIQWALRKGKAAILTGCGSGKTFMQLEWANHVYKHSGNVLIVAPLNVVKQTEAEHEKFDIETPITVCRTGADVKAGINITNYEMLSHFEGCKFAGVVLDESSILKSYTGKTTHQITDMFISTPYKLACTATIAPNDYTEIGTTCEFLGIMSRPEMLATYFVHDSGDTSKWRLKKSGKNRFWEWMATWAIYFSSPADLGYTSKDYELPPLEINTVMTESDIKDFELFAKAAETLQERREARRESLPDRIEKAASLISNNPDEQWLIWCDFNYEADELRKSIPGCVEVRGSDDPEFKADASLRFAQGDINSLVSKPTIFGFGSNFQKCHNMIFCGLSDSYEQFYQAVRRCWRFGQDKPVNVYVIISDREINVLENIKRKAAQMDEMQKQMTALMKDITLSEIHKTKRDVADYIPAKTMAMPSFISN